MQFLNPSCIQHTVPNAKFLAQSRLLELLLHAELVAVTALLLPAVHRADGEASVASEDKEGKERVSISGTPSQVPKFVPAMFPLALGKTRK